MTRICRKRIFMAQNNNRMAELIRALLTVPMTSMNNLYLTQIPGGADPENKHGEAGGELRGMTTQQNNPEPNWPTEIDGSDRRPDQTRFSPRKKLNGQLPTMNYTPADLFKLYFTNSQLDILVDNTNKNEGLVCKWKYSRRDVNLLSSDSGSDFVYK